MGFARGDGEVDFHAVVIAPAVPGIAPQPSGTGTRRIERSLRVIAPLRRLAAAQVSATRFPTTAPCGPSSPPAPPRDPPSRPDRAGRHSPTGHPAIRASAGPLRRAARASGSPLPWRRAPPRNTRQRFAVAIAADAHEKPGLPESPAAPRSRPSPPPPVPPPRYHPARPSPRQPLPCSNA